MYTITLTLIKQKVNDQNNNKETEADLLVDRNKCEKNDILAGDFFVVQYDENCYCGQVFDTNNNDNTVRVNFMSVRKCNNTLNGQPVRTLIGLISMTLFRTSMFCCHK